ncbi:MAG: rRNA maturation RNase YbeY [Clostridia bacterium]
MVIDVDYDVATGVTDKEEKVYLKRYAPEVTKLVKYIIREELFTKIEGDKPEEVMAKLSIVNTILVSISFASEEDIREINREYRNVDRSTDVLSFPMFAIDEIKEMKKHVKASVKAYELDRSTVKDKYKFNNSKFSNITLGDILICFDVVKRQAAEYDHSLGRELMYMITHAMLHLFGYDHEIEEDKRKMRKREECILNRFGYKLED